MSENLHKTGSAELVKSGLKMIPIRPPDALPIFRTLNDRQRFAMNHGKRKNDASAH
jgi:hypothetical protein